ncbi:MAG TPA: SusC/RagA family protein, partial [Prevotella sp.]|nr:SusC/RagA family protein [Prevotella sp.]
QSKKVTGQVVESEGPVMGATVMEEGTNNGTVTDLDGNLVLEVQRGATLIVSDVGYKTREIKVSGQSQVEITMASENKNLDEVVVVGYGVQKKKLVTGATLEVKGDDISRLNTTQVLGALQSQSPGVNIQAASGQPGDGFKISIRGAGTNGNTAPLYVIDGVAGGDISNLNPADIERIDVLKDAASAAIYGSAAANGVILVTTKQGHQGKIQTSYDAYIGWQNVYKMPQLLTAKQYMDVEDRVRFNSGEEPWNWSNYIDADLLKSYQDGTNSGTNWLELLRNKNALTTSHAFNVTGGSDRSTFSTGVGYQYQDGIFGNMAKSDYRRFTLRLNSEHVLYRNAEGLDVIKFGENIYFSHKQNQGLQIGNQYANEISNMLRANPCVPLYDAEGNYFNWHDIQASGTGSTKGWQNYNSYTKNPIYTMMNNQSANNKSKNFNLSAVGYFEIQPIKNLVYRGQFNYNQSSWSYRTYLGKFDANETNADGFRRIDQVTQQEGLGWGWSTTHTLNYKFNIVRRNHFDILGGTEYGESKPDFGESMIGISHNSIYGDFSHAYLSLTSASERNGDATVTGTPYDDTRNLSYFGRINYDYNETYMLTVIFRADGSSSFAPGHRWGYFPSFSGGWVITNEKWMQPTTPWLDYLKVRASWGQNGNRNNVDAFAYQATFAYDDFSNYSFNNDKKSYTAGASPSRLANENLKWETSEQSDFGIDARFLHGRLGLTFDWYNKETKDLLLRVPVAPTTGFSTELKNAGTVRNRGIELALSWHDKIGSDFTYGANWNIAVNHNKVTKVNSSQKYNEGGLDLLAQNTGYLSRFEEGHAIGYFYGYKTAGVIQNQTDLAQYVKDDCGGNAANSLQGAGLKPGDLKFVDTNGDGKITVDDKTDLGNPNPDVTMGLSLNAAYKGFDFSVSGYAALGQQVARSWRKFTDGEAENYTTEVYSYWNGEGTSNRYPLLARMNTGVNWQSISDIYIDNSGYFRLQNMTLGYDFKKLWRNNPFSQLRLYVSVQNLFTITNYKGMDPENGIALNSNEPWVTGVDVGNYPQARTWLIGVNVKF